MKTAIYMVVTLYSLIDIYWHLGAVYCLSLHIRRVCWDKSNQLLIASSACSFDPECGSDNVRLKQRQTCTMLYEKCSDKLSRDLDGELCRLVTRSLIGFCTWRLHLPVMGILGDAMCRKCRQEQDSSCTLLQCPDFSRRGIDIVMCRMVRVTNNYGIRRMIGFINT
jgi:hypothetical protein